MPKRDRPCSAMTLPVANVTSVSDFPAWRRELMLYSNGLKEHCTGWRPVQQLSSESGSCGKPLQHCDPTWHNWMWWAVTRFHTSSQCRKGQSSTHCHLYLGRFIRNHCWKMYTLLSFGARREIILAHAWAGQIKLDYTVDLIKSYKVDCDSMTI